MADPTPIYRSRCYIAFRSVEGGQNGWALLAHVDLLDRLPSGHPMRDTLISLFRQHISGIVRYQEDGGLWHQLLAGVEVMKIED